ncbi:AsmA family protein [Sinomicrobium soli]|uniref:hypothetical protein n=1 Tax=Sinomicrobium sp. N-1-3-6 TaxID=2219864 RepID=UPI000DCD0BDE|nr:hypothetical protein [Sinomicrobium sp. N-1-3-6]RAV30172.1 hypothetical protein DN748_05090 [Sinomicrobium sp. N-1-3-6]
MKRRSIIALSVLALVVGGYVILNHLAHRKIGSLLDEQVEKGNLEYKNFSISLLRGNAAIYQANYRKGRQRIKADQVRVRGFSYWRYLLKDQVSVQKIIVDTPHLDIRRTAGTGADSSTEAQKNTTPGKNIRITQLDIHNGSLNLVKDTSAILTVKKYDLQLRDITADQQSLQRKIPVNYGAFSLEVSELWHDLNTLQEVKVSHLSLSEKTAEAHNIRLIPKYTVKDYVRVIPYEKDLMELKLDTLSIPQYQLELNKENPHFSAPGVFLRDIDFDVYRDKTVEDDIHIKKLYSHMLRELELKLDIDSLHIDRARIRYRELIHKERPPGEVFFTGMKAVVTGLTNTGLERKDFPATELAIETMFMGKSPLSVHWSFRVNDPSDTFTISGKSSGIPSESINSFFVPAFHTKTQGEVNQLYFNFGGDLHTASGDFQIKFSNFTVEVLRKDGKEKRGFLTWIANIFVRESSEGQDIAKHVDKVERDKTKSFWNYFWSCIEAGLAKTLI